MTEHLEHLILAYACTEAVGPIVGSYEDSKSEGVYLASKLITNIAQRQYSHVRPELLLLFATESPSQRNAELKPRVTVELNKDRNFQELLDGVWAKLRSDKSRDWESVPLVGCSAAACMADGNVYEDGTVLIALCSVSPNALQNSTAEDVQGRKPTRQRAIRVLKTTCSLEAIDDPNKAAEDLCKNLRLIHAESDFNPHENRFVMLFLPGYRKVEGGDPKYEDPRILRAFCEKTRYEIPVCGGSGAQAFGSRDSGFQFIGDKCYKNAAVAALIECDTQFGIAMNSSFKPMSPPQFIRINVQDDNRRRVEFTAVDTTCDRIEECRKQDTLLILGARNEEGDPTIYIPRLEKAKAGCLTFWRDVDEHHDLELLEAGPDEPREAIGRIFQAARKRAGLGDRNRIRTMKAPHHSQDGVAAQTDAAPTIAGAITFFCAGRLGYPGMEPPNWPPILKQAASLLEERHMIGAFVNGECGLDRTGRGVHNNLQLSSLVLGTQLSLEAQLRWGYKALSKVSKRMMEANSVDEAIAAALDGLLEAGFRGGMLSLLCPEGDDLVKPAAVVAQGARGGCWPNIIQLTRRRLDDADLDILAYVCQKAKSQYVRNAWAPNSRSEKNSREIVGVKSMFVGLLKVAKHEPLGVLQIDLGDRTMYKHLPRRLRQFLDAYVNVVGSALQRAISNEQERANREITDAIYEAFEDRDTSKAAKKIIGKLLNVLKLDMGYVRLRSPDGKYLVWCAGEGPYSAAISRPKSTRYAVSVTEIESSSSAASFGSDKVHGSVTNDVSQSPRAISLRQELQTETDQNAAELEALRQVKSFVNLRFSSDKKASLGVLDIDAREPWFFTQNKVDIIINAALRFGLCLRTSQTQEQLANLTKLHGIASEEIGAVSLSPQEHHVPQALIEGVKQLCATQTDVKLWTYHHGNEQLQLLSRDTGRVVPDTHVRLSVADALGKALQGSQTSWIRLSDSSLPHFFRQKIDRDSLAGCAVMPLRAGGAEGRLVGALFCVCAQRPSSLLEDTLTQYAASAAHALQNWQLVQAGRELAGCQALSDVESVLQAHAAKLAGATAGCVWIYHEKIARYQLGPLWGYPRFMMECIRPRKSENTFKLKEGNEAFMYIQGDLKDRTRPEIFTHQPGIKSWAGVRLVHGDSFVGVVYLDFPTEIKWAERSKLFFLEYAGYLGATLDRLSRDEALRNTELLVRHRIFSDVALYSTLGHVDALDFWQLNLQDQLATLGSQDVNAREMAVSRANTIVQGISETVQRIKGQMPGGDNRNVSYEPESFDLAPMIKQKWDDAVKSRLFPLNRQGKAIEYLRKNSTTAYCQIILKWPRNLLAQILNIVIANALDAMDDFVLSEEGKKDDMEIVFTIDQQPGNESDVWLHLWNKHPTFEQTVINEVHFGKLVLMRRGQGRGFQLVRAILSQSGGSIIVSNVTPPEHGCGSTVRLRIPIECPQNAFPRVMALDIDPGE